MEQVTLLRTGKDELGLLQRRILYWYTISPAIQDGATPPNNVAPQRRAELPGESLVYVPEADRAAIDNGTAGFEVVTRQQTAGETLAAFRARVLTDHHARETAWIAQQRELWAQSGLGASG